MSRPTAVPLDLTEMELEAKEKAKKQVANLLQRPDQLEKVEQIRKRVTRKKGSVEAMLKTAVQSNLDGVRAGMTQLHMALKDIREIKTSLDEIDKTHRSIAHLGEKLKVMREENSRHSQLAAAVENLKHIFNVPEVVRKTEDLIADGKLLQAHKTLTELETARNDLLYETHKQSMDSSDRQMVERYFYKVGPLSEQLGKQLFLILQRAISSIRQDPSLIVTVLRIIEREQRVDAFAKNRQDRTGFETPGRPKNWRQKCFDTLEETVKSRVEGNQIEDRDSDKMWLVRHLEVTRLLVLEDLRVVKTLFEPCFPPYYNIVDRYVKMYHTEIQKHLSDNIIDYLEGNEIVTLLTWVHLYNSTELMGHPSLKIDTSSLGPLLDNDMLVKLQNQYISTLQTNFREWMLNSLKTDSKDWFGGKPPDGDDKGYFNTSLPVILFQMIEQNLTVAGTINDTLMVKVLNLCIQELENFCGTYKGELWAYKERHFLDRREPEFFLPFMIANVNNCDSFRDLIYVLNEKYQKGDIDEKVKPNRVKDAGEMFMRLGHLGCGFLLEEVFMDLNPHLKQLITKNWVQSSNQVDTICITLEDYCQDFVHLKDYFFESLISKAEEKISMDYLRALLSGNMRCKSYEERVGVAEKVIREGDQLKTLFFKIAKKSKQSSALDVLSMLAEVIKLRDTSMMSFELQGIINAYPDMTQDHLINLLIIREDCNRVEAKQMVVETMGEEMPQAQSQGIFTQLMANVGQGFQETFSQK